MYGGWGVGGFWVQKAQLTVTRTGRQYTDSLKSQPISALKLDTG